MISSESKAPSAEFEALTSRQKEAVTSTEKQTVVIAGPGSGKTTVITERIKYLLINCHVPAGSVIALTFCSKAANEMRTRLTSAFPTQKLNIRTFHSFGLHLIRLFADLLGYGEKLKIASRKERAKVMWDILSQKKIRNRTDDYLKAVSDFKNNTSKDSDLPYFHDFMQQYNGELKAQNMIDFEDMIYLPLILIKQNEEVHNYVTHLFQHVLVDEFQDVNDTQAELIHCILGEDTSLFIVGDDDQCIYQWRGSNPELLDSIARERKSRTIILEDNFRSENEIVSLANQLITHNHFRLQKKMAAKCSDVSDSGVQFLRCNSDEEQAVVCGQIIHYLMANFRYQYKDIAILVRSFWQADAIKQHLDAEGIPYLVENFENSPMYEPFMHVLFAVNDFSDAHHLMAAVNFPDRVLDRFIWEQLQKDSPELNGHDGWDALNRLYYSDEVFENSAYFRARYHLLNDLSRKKQIFTASEIAETLLQYYESELRQRGKEEDEHFEFARQVALIANEFTVAGAAPDSQCELAEFLDYLQTALLDESAWKWTENAVSIMTCHKSKGLEFPAVLIPGVQVGVFPNDLYVRNRENLEEERRLLYVAMTRAEKFLYILSSEDPLTVPRPSDIIKSGFVAEIPSLITKRF